MSKSYKSFWIIFDTGFKPPYYQDVHNILAMPHGSIVRYNYSDKYLSKEAIEFANTFPEAPTKLLLAYCQYANFRRGDDRSKFTSSDQIIWTPTRLSEIVHIQASAENYYFDIKLLDFPYLVKEAKNQIFSELQQKKEIPFDLLVVISSRHNELETLEERADKDTNWDSIVNWFQQENTQFKDDSFWHLRGPYDASNNALILQSYEHDEITVGNSKKVLHKTSHFSVHNQQELWFEVINREPRNYLTKHTNAGVIVLNQEDPQQEVISRLLQVDDRSGRIKTETSEIKLRPYFSQTLKFLVHADKMFASQDSIVSFRTIPQNSEWAEGPNLELTFRTTWILWRILLGIFLAVLGLTFAFIGNKLPATNMIIAIIFFVVGTILILVSSYILYRELKFKY